VSSKICNFPCKQTGSYLDLNIKYISLLLRFYRACTPKKTFLYRTKDRKNFMNSLNYPFPWFLMVQPFCVILSAPVVFQLARRTSQETQQVFDWLISILHLSQVFSTVVFHSVCQFHASGKERRILSTLVWAVFVKTVILSKKKGCVRLKSSELKDNFVVNMAYEDKPKHWNSYRRKKQLRLTVMSFIFLFV